MSKRIKIAAVIVVVALFTAFACGCVFDAAIEPYTVTYYLCDNAESPASYAEGESNPATYTPAAIAIELVSPLRDGYVFRGWYDDAEYSGNGITALAPGTSGDLTLYARWEVTRPTGVDGDHTDETVATWRGFLPYLEKFDAAYSAGNMATVTVESRDELAAYCEYVQYKYVTEATAPTVTIGYDFTSATAADEIIEVKRSAYFRSYIGLNFSASAKATPRTKIYVQYADYIGREAAKTCADSDYFTQIAPYVYAEAGAAHDFAIDGVESTLNCATSNQLFYAAMIGARPVPDEGSAAAEIYAEARATLTAVVNDGMAADQKARAIYDWLVMNVTYDEDLIQDRDASQLPAAIEYDAFYLEGVFGSGRAVCDGIAKAMTLLCRIEGIPCVRVAGNDHAWNKVYIGGKWYVVDATFGDTGTDITDAGGHVYTFLSHRTFLVPESFDADHYERAENYRGEEYTADTDFDFYNYEYVVIDGTQRFNLKIDNAQEFRELYDYALNLDIQGPYSVDFYVADKKFVTAGTCAFDAAGNYCTLLFNVS